LEDFCGRGVGEGQFGGGAQADVEDCEEDEENGDVERRGEGVALGVSWVVVEGVGRGGGYKDSRINSWYSRRSIGGC
jgi:hypothetical protein